MSNQNSLEILDGIMEVLRQNSIGTNKIPKIENLEMHSGAQDSGGSSEVSCNINSSDSYDISPSGGILTINITTPNEQCEMENFSPQSFRLGDIIMLSIIVAAVQSHLIPAFDIDMDTIKCHESKATAIATTAATQFTSLDSQIPASYENTRTKNVFPSLSFTDARNSFCLTFSTVSVFGEIVIYSSRKNYNEKKTTKQNNSRNQGSGKSTVQSVSIGNEKKKKIQTLYLNPDNFISFAPSDDNDVSYDIKEKSNDNGDVSSCDKNDDNERYKNDTSNRNNNEQFIQNYSGSNHDTESIENNKMTTKLHTELNNSDISSKKILKKKYCKTELNKNLSCVQIGSYDVKLFTLTSRITKMLLDPLLIEK
jgi:hypothetical protein